MLSLLLTWKFFLPVLFQLFLNLILFPGFAVTRWWDKGEELQSFRSLPWDFSLLTKPWLKRLLFFFFLVPRISKHIKVQLEWMKLSDNIGKWEGWLRSSDLDEIFAKHLASGFQAQGGHPNTHQPWKKHLQNSTKNIVFLQTLIIKLFLYLVYLFQGWNNLEHTITAVYSNSCLERELNVLFKSHTGILQQCWN